MVASIDLPPLGISSARLFLQSQFCSKPQPAPKELDLSGKTYLLTGASGIVLHAARQLLDHKLSHLIFAVRNRSKDEPTAAELRKKHPNARIELWDLEMTSYPSIQALAARAATLRRLDAVLLNSAITSPSFGTVPTTGHERVVQINYLSTLLLAILMLPVLKDKKAARGGAAGRLTIVSSGVAFFAKLPNRDARPFLPSFDDTSVTPWDMSERYLSSKLLGHLAATKLTPLVRADDVVLNLVDPGYCKGSGLHREAKGMLSMIVELSKQLTGRTMELGASCYVDAVAVKGPETHGCYLMDWKILP
jgi:NAD(P)-dependent dehydrogenase (short-subunit alcohol dehydrogenase family)